MFILCYQAVWLFSIYLYHFANIFCIFRQLIKQWNYQLKIFVILWTVWSFMRSREANEKSDVLHEGERKDSTAEGSGLRGRGSQVWETLRIETLCRPRLGHVGLEWSKLVIFHAIPTRRSPRSIKNIPREKVEASHRNIFGKQYYKSHVQMKCVPFFFVSRAFFAIITWFWSLFV